MARTTAPVVVIAASLAATAAMAQTSDTQARQPVHKAALPAGDQLPDMFVTKQTVTEWRAPKLVGISVYGQDDKQVGTIKDILIEHDGSAGAIVIGVGGFLGIGTKDVAVPFSAMQWRTESRKAPATDQPPGNTLTPITGTTEQHPPMKETDPVATEASQGYPDKAVLNLTVAQLKTAPDFEYAPHPPAPTAPSSSPRPASQ
jgi:PRC-barrel domain